MVADILCFELGYPGALQMLDHAPRWQGRWNDLALRSGRGSRGSDNVIGPSATFGVCPRVREALSQVILPHECLRHVLDSACPAGASESGTRLLNRCRVLPVETGQGPASWPRGRPHFSY